MGLTGRSSGLMFLAQYSAPSALYGRILSTLYIYPYMPGFRVGADELDRGLQSVLI